MTKSFIIELFSPSVLTSHVFWISVAESLDPLEADFLWPRLVISVLLLKSGPKDTPFVRLFPSLTGKKPSLNPLQQDRQGWRGWPDHED